MTNKGNLYIEALKEGRNRMKEGITFDELRGYLEQNGFMDEFRNADFLHYFNYWFYNNFYHPAITPNLKIHTSNSERTLSNLHAGDKTKCVMTGEAYENLIDFENLEEARSSSKHATQLAIKSIKYARIALWVTVGIGIIQILISLFQSATFKSLNLNFYF